MLSLVFFSCGLHHVDLVTQRVFKALKSESFYKKLTKIMSYLRCQKNLIEKVKSKCPNIADTRWLSTGSGDLVCSKHNCCAAAHRRTLRRVNHPGLVADNHGSFPDSKVFNPVRL
jgi:hypothetical protein